MHSVGIAFEILDRYRHGLVGLKKFTGHMVLDVNMDIQDMDSSQVYEGIKPYWRCIFLQG